MSRAPDASPFATDAASEEADDAILIVEDDPLLLQALIQRARALGCQALGAADANDALELASGCDLALVDLGLPPHPAAPDEGLRLIETLRIFHPLLPVLALTGQDERACALAAIERGAFDFLVKPVSGDALAAAIGRGRRFAKARRALASAGREELFLSPGETAQGLRETVSLAQEKLIRQTLASCGGSVAEAARRLKLPRSQLYYYLRKFGLRQPDGERG